MYHHSKFHQHIFSFAGFSVQTEQSLDTLDCFQYSSSQCFSSLHVGSPWLTAAAETFPGVGHPVVRPPS